ncbi:hypothetical protein GMORB2_4822 [Geosmithia morbida]|uniref:Uncharacterized protein n=1 Tax=Geosmithia morbida TaxID=1094350 RepID=A0A9P4YLR3_9HYPO|nr:uncharacterized protein GMORB2_4822 [Geosmithia morbida]KAF4119303.1 hypothetical protein GMORB2_4822 [Geosmithia morbida]
MQACVAARSSASSRCVCGLNARVARMKCSGTTANLFSTRTCAGSRSAMRSGAGGSSNGSNGLDDGSRGGPLGLLARDGEKRSWNWTHLVVS